MENNTLLAQLAAERVALAARRAGLANLSATSSGSASTPTASPQSHAVEAPLVLAHDETGRPITAALLAANREARQAAASAASLSTQNAPSITSGVTSSSPGNILGGAPAPVRPQFSLPVSPTAVSTAPSTGYVLGGALPSFAAPLTQQLAAVPAVPIYEPGSGEAMLAAMRAKEAAEKTARDRARTEVLRSRQAGQLRPASRGFASGAGPGTD